MLGCCAHSNELSRSIFADCLWSCWFLQKHCAACSLLLAVLLVRRTACSCVLCVVRVCVHSAALQHLQSCVLRVVPVCVHSAALQQLQSCVLYRFVFTVLPYRTYRAACCVLYRFVFTVLPYSTYRAVCCVL